MALILVERCDGYAVLTLNRPEAMNALSRALRTELAETVQQLEADPDIRVLILTGAGKAFSAGLDLKELGAGGATVDDAVTVGDPVSALTQFSGPVIGAINGVAITGGFELALACDILIASDTARFADTHARVGVMPGWGLSQKLSRLIGIGRAKQVSLTGNFVSAAQAAEWGLVNSVVAAEDLLPTARRLAEDMLSTLPHMLLAYKKLIDDGYGMSFAEAMALEKARSNAYNKSVTAESIEAQREQVRQRGQAQQ